MPRIRATVTFAPAPPDAVRASAAWETLDTSPLVRGVTSVSLPQDATPAAVRAALVPAVSADVVAALASAGLDANVARLAGLFTGPIETNV